MRTSGFNAASQAVPNRSKAWPNIVLREDVHRRLSRLVRRFERCADVVQATPEARVIGAIHWRNALGGADGVGEGDDGGSAVEMAVAVVYGGMRTGARAGWSESMAALLAVGCDERSARGRTGTAGAAIDRRGFFLGCEASNRSACVVSL